MSGDFYFRSVKPHGSLADFVESFWLLEIRSEEEKEVVILPDGRMDLFFYASAAAPFRITLSGLETHPDTAILGAQTIMFAASFKLLAVEYIFHNNIAHLLDSAQHMPPGFWDFNADDLQDFDLFCGKCTQKIQSLLPPSTDNRKRRLFDLLYSSNGALSVQELSERVFWSSRQINRYFSRQFGISLKAYCNILRFRASLPHIKAGKLFPEQNFADQSHFIKEVKKLSGVSLGELRKNQNDRFIQFSMLPPE